MEGADFGLSVAEEHRDLPWRAWGTEVLCGVFGAGRLGTVVQVFGVGVSGDTVRCGDGDQLGRPLLGAFDAVRLALRVDAPFCPFLFDLFCGELPVAFGLGLDGHAVLTWRKANGVSGPARGEACRVRGPNMCSQLRQAIRTGRR